jgi:hypothetical protein
MSVFECSVLQLRDGSMCEFDVLALQAPGLLLGRMREFVQQRWVVGARHTLHVILHTSHITRYTLYVTRHTSHVTHHTSHVTCHALSHTTCRMHADEWMKEQHRLIESDARADVERMHMQAEALVR